MENKKYEAFNKNEYDEAIEKQLKEIEKPMKKVFIIIDLDTNKYVKNYNSITKKFEFTPYESKAKGFNLDEASEILKNDNKNCVLREI